METCTSESLLDDLTECVVSYFNISLDSGRCSDIAINLVRNLSGKIKIKMLKTEK
jgi:hypothetical protein